jgi:hypothetical protein
MKKKDVNYKLLVSDMFYHPLSLVTAVFAILNFTDITDIGQGIVAAPFLFLFIVYVVLLSLTWYVGTSDNDSYNTLKSRVRSYANSPDAREIHKLLSNLVNKKYVKG